MYNDYKKWNDAFSYEMINIKIQKSTNSSLIHENDHLLILSTKAPKFFNFWFREKVHQFKKVYQF